MRILARSAALDILYGFSLVPEPDQAHAVAVVSSITSSSIAARLVAPSPLDKGAKKFFFSIVLFEIIIFSIFLISISAKQNGFRLCRCQD